MSSPIAIVKRPMPIELTDTQYFCEIIASLISTVVNTPDAIVSILAIVGLLTGASFSNQVNPNPQVNYTYLSEDPRPNDG